MRIWSAFGNIQNVSKSLIEASGRVNLLILKPSFWCQFARTLRRLRIQNTLGEQGSLICGEESSLHNNTLTTPLIRFQELGVIHFVYCLSFLSTIRFHFFSFQNKPNTFKLEFLPLQGITYSRYTCVRVYQLQMAWLSRFGLTTVIEVKPFWTEARKWVWILEVSLRERTEKLRIFVWNRIAIFRAHRARATHPH